MDYSETEVIKKEEKAKNKVNTPFGYFGSKNKIALEICRDLPPHNCWVEAFCGSAALTLSKAPAPIEIINDIDNEITNLFSQLRNNSEKLTKLIELTPYAENELIQARISDPNINELERARRFLVQSMMAINGVFGDQRSGFSYSDSYSRNGHEARVNRWNNLPMRLAQVVARLKNIRIESKDARIILRRFLNRPATLIYLDPPYLGNRSKGYNIDANDIAFHEEMLTLANSSKAMIFISGYENDLYDEILTSTNGWSRRTISAKTNDVKGKSYPRTEVLWMNRHFKRATELKTIPIELTLKEEKEKKLNPLRED